MKRILTSLFTVAAIWGLASAARADTPGRHPMYLHALTDLRAARAHLERPAGFQPGATQWDERVAIHEIDAAMNEIQRAAIWDGKPLSDHPPIDAQLDWRGRLRRSLELLHQAEGDISQAEDNGNRHRQHPCGEFMWLTDEQAAVIKNEPQPQAHCSRLSLLDGIGEVNGQAQKVRRKDAQRAARVEDAEVVFLLTQLQQNAGDEIAGEDEEEIDEEETTHR